MKQRHKEDISRRQLLRLLAALGITGPAALQVAAQARKKVSPQALKAATAIIEHDFDDDRLELVSRALQRNLEQFQSIRDLELDDLLEPAIMFVPRGR